jgi:hypothetical protein
MKKYLQSLTDKELIFFNQNRSLIEFCHRFWYSLDDMDNITPEIQEVIVNLLWNNLFNVMSPFHQTIINHDGIIMAEKETKWEYISKHDFEITKEYIEFEKNKWESYFKDKEASLSEAKKLFNKIIHQEYFK